MGGWFHKKKVRGTGGGEKREHVSVGDTLVGRKKLRAGGIMVGKRGKREAPEPLLGEGNMFGVLAKGLKTGRWRRNKSSQEEGC